MDIQESLTLSAYLFFVGIVVESMSAAISSARRDIDIVGAVIIGNVTAFGGGTVRDILLGRWPLTWVAHPNYLVLTTICALTALALAPVIHRYAYRVFLYLDALGLVAFTLLTTRITMDFQLSYVNVCIFAMIAGISGGMLRDIFCNEVPLVFHKELYAVVSLLCSLSYIVLAQLFPTHPHIIEAVIFILGFSLRIAAVEYDIKLPKLKF